ncbi:unnamed protein product [Rotaria socialis]
MTPIKVFNSNNKLFNRITNHIKQSFEGFSLISDDKLYQFFFFSVVAFYAWMFTSKHLAKSVRKTWKNQPASSLGKAVLKD